MERCPQCGYAPEQKYLLKAGTAFTLEVDGTICGRLCALADFDLLDWLRKRKGTMVTLPDALIADGLLDWAPVTPEFLEMRVSIKAGQAERV